MADSAPMKIALRVEEGCAVLEVTGEITTHNVAVLKAGLTNLFQNGKNRIVVHIVDGENISGDVIRELAILDVMARELSGKIVLASESETLRAKVLTFAKPPVVNIVPSVAKASAYLKGLDPISGEEAGEPASELIRRLDASNRRATALESQLRAVDGSQSAAVRAENARLTERIALLEGQVADLAGQRKEPATDAGLREKIVVLEQAVLRLGGEKLAPGAAK